MRVFLLIFSALLFMGADDQDRLRIVSTSLCGDSYVLSMGGEQNILALSWQSGDNMSPAPQTMRKNPKAWDDIERLLALSPTLVVFGAGEGGQAKPLLDKAGIAHISIDWGEDFPSITKNFAALAKALGKQAPTFKTPALSKRASRPALLYLSASGGTAGPGTYVDAAITAAGGVNIITTPGWHTPDPETLATLKPDLIVLSFFKDGYASINEAGLRHKTLQAKINATPHVHVPGKLWPCAGPGLYEATAIIAGAIAELN